jgi:hypothetical protein
MAAAKARSSKVLGSLCFAMLFYISMVFSAPTKWNLQVLGGRPGLVAALVLCVGMSVLAARLGSRKWYILTAWAIIIFLYLGFFYKPPMWT